LGEQAKRGTAECLHSPRGLGRAEERKLDSTPAISNDPNTAEPGSSIIIFSLATSALDASLLPAESYSPRANLGTAFLQLGRLNEALAHFEKPMEINPLNVEAQNNMALVLATFPETRLRNDTKAIELAEPADHLTGNENASINATLAARLCRNRTIPQRGRNRQARFAAGYRSGQYGIS
jgi:tetratricopeptide (TPR) repeat protein